MEIKVNDKIGDWTVISIAEKRNRKKYWKTKCNCGRISEVDDNSLKNNRSQGCLDCRVNKSAIKRRNIPEIGSVFNKWTLLDVEIPIKGKTLLVMQCECGSIYKKHLGQQKTSNQCVKCYADSMRSIPHLKSRKGYKDISSSYWTALKTGAKARSYEFSITIEYAWNLYIKQNKKCNLSGIDLNLGYSYCTGEQTGSIDRIDNSKGYIEGNVQWVHKQINWMKHKMPQNHFIYLCKQVANNNK